MEEQEEPADYAEREKLEKLDKDSSGADFGKS